MNASMTASLTNLYWGEISHDEDEPNREAGLSKSTTHWRPGAKQPWPGPVNTPLWYDYDLGGDVSFIIAAKSRKARLITIGERVSLVVQQEQHPYSYVSVEGVVTSIDATTEDALLAMATRYLGAEQGQRYADASDIGAQISVRMRPENWLTVDYGKQ